MSKKPTPPARKPLAAAKGPAKGPSVSTLDTSAVNMVQVRALDNRLKQIEDFQKSLKEFLSRNPIFEFCYSRGERCLQGRHQADSLEGRSFSDRATGYALRGDCRVAEGLAYDPD